MDVLGEKELIVYPLSTGQKSLEIYTITKNYTISNYCLVRIVLGAWDELAPVKFGYPLAANLLTSAFQVH